MPDKITITDVDGTTPGVAMLVSADLRAGYNAEVRHATFVEGEYGCTDPHESVERFRAAIGDDFPGHSFSVLLNERARYLMTQRRARHLLGPDTSLSPAKYVDSHRAEVGA